MAFNAGHSKAEFQTEPTTHWRAFWLAVEGRGALETEMIEKFSLHRRSSPPSLQSAGSDASRVCDEGEQVIM